VLFAGLVPAWPDRLREPDPYTYRASIAALRDGNVTMTPAAYTALDAELHHAGDGWTEPSPACASGAATPGGNAARCGHPGPLLTRS